MYGGALDSTGLRDDEPLTEALEDPELYGGTLELTTADDLLAETLELTTADDLLTETLELTAADELLAGMLELTTTDDKLAGTLEEETGSAEELLTLTGPVVTGAELDRARLLLCTPDDLLEHTDLRDLDDEPFFELETIGALDDLTTGAVPDEAVIGAELE